MNTNLTPYLYELNSNEIDPLKLFQDTTGQAKLGVGSTVWDSAIITAKYLEKNVKTIKGKSILDFSCGIGLVGCVVQRIAQAYDISFKKLVFSDKLGNVELAKFNYEQNFNIIPDNVKFMTLEWDNIKQIENALEIGPYDIVIASDIVVWPETFSSIIDTLKGLCDSNTTIFLTYETRDAHNVHNFFELFEKAFICENVTDEDLDEFYRSEDIHVKQCRLK